MEESRNFTYKYPHPAVTTDCVIFGYDPKEGLSVLLVQRGIDPYRGCWAFPGGFLQLDPEKGPVDENAEAGARRELKEETGLNAAYVEEFGCFSDINRDPRERVITIAHFALVKKEDVKGADDAAEAKWFPIDNIPSLAFDHDRILRVALRKLKEKIHFEPVGFELMPEIFTMPQLQDLYESLLEIKFDRRNFASKMLKLGILDEVGQRPKNAGPRIAVKYSFNKENYEAMKSKGFRLEF